jgi:glycerol-3-phosphate dehydrogenase
LLLNARAAVAIAPAAAALLAGELGKDEAWKRAQVEAFSALAKQYIPQGATYPEMPAS